MAAYARVLYASISNTTRCAKLSNVSFIVLLSMQEKSKERKEERKEIVYIMLQRNGNESNLNNDLIYNLILIGFSSLFLYITLLVLSKFLLISPCFMLTLIRSSRLLPVYSYFSCFCLSRNVVLSVIRREKS